VTSLFLIRVQRNPGEEEEEGKKQQEEKSKVNFFFVVLWMTSLPTSTPLRRRI